MHIFGRVFYDRIASDSNYDRNRQERLSSNRQEHISEGERFFVWSRDSELFSTGYPHHHLA